MKFTSLFSFKAHVQPIPIDQLAPLYLILSKDAYERKEAENTLISKFQEAVGKKQEAVRIFDACRDSVENVLQELGSLSFFASSRLILLQNTDKLTKEAAARIEIYLNAPYPGTTLVLVGESINRSSKLYKALESHGIVVDIEEVKPWEKEKKLLSQVTEWANLCGKTFEGEAARYLINYANADTAALRQEFDKLCCYTGNKKTLSLEDVQGICTVSKTETGWQLGEAIFRKESAAAIAILQALLLDGTHFISLARQLRTQFQTKLLVCSVLNQGGGAREIQEKFPYMKGQILQNHLQQAQGFGFEKLRKGILAIDEAELQAKNSSVDSDLIAYQLIFKLIGQSA